MSSGQPEPAGGSRGVVLRGPDGATFRFDPGVLCLLLAVTGGEGERAAYETLVVPADLRAWMDETLGLRATGVDGAALVAAKALREAIWHSAVARARGERLPRQAASAINRAAATPTPIPRIDGSGQRAFTAPVTAAQVLSLLARDAIDLLTGPLADRLRQCEGAGCTLIFVDTSRPGGRRWCSMQRCGNRAKARSSRNRRRQRAT